MWWFWYKDEKCIFGADVMGVYQVLLETVRARQETVIRSFKRFSVLDHRL